MIDNINVQYNTYITPEYQNPLFNLKTLVWLGMLFRHFRFKVTCISSQTTKIPGYGHVLDKVNWSITDVIDTFQWYIVHRREREMI